MKKVLIIRLGAYGDHLCVSHVLKRLKELGYYVIYNTNKRGKEVFEHCPHIDELLVDENDMPIDELEAHWEKIKRTD
jgi:ADP-heptose:LPS heptosyltransferase